MKGNYLRRLAVALGITVLLAAALAVTAFADSPVCTTCGGALRAAPQEFRKVSETHCAQVYICDNGHRQLAYDSQGDYLGKSAHVPVRQANCTQAALCGNCNETYGAVGGHQVVIDPAVAPTCTRTGLTQGSHCSVCNETLTAQTVVEATGHTYGKKGKVTEPTCDSKGYTTYTCTVCGHQKKSKEVGNLSHWYDEWQPTGVWRNSAPCKRPGCTHVKTTDCDKWNFKLTLLDGEEQTVEQYTLCPVCGQVSDGSRLELVKNADPNPQKGWVPEGDLLFRQGTMENGEQIICVGWEFDARLVQCYGDITFSVPASLLEGYELMLLDKNGGETPVEVTLKGKRAYFDLDFTNTKAGNRTLVKVLHMVPLEEEAVNP